MKNINEKVKETQNEIIETLKSSQLPGEIILLILEDFQKQVKSQIEGTVNDIVNFGKGIEPANPEEYDFDMNYRPQHAG